MARNGTLKSLDRAQEIYLIAAQIFFTKGYNATSLNDIADAPRVLQKPDFIIMSRANRICFIE